MANVVNHFNVFHWQGQNPQLLALTGEVIPSPCFPMQLAAHGRHLLVKTTYPSITESPPVV